MSERTLYRALPPEKRRKLEKDLPTELLDKLYVNNFRISLMFCCIFRKSNTAYTTDEFQLLSEVR